MRISTSAERADGIDPERPADLLAHLVGERRSSSEKNGFGPGGGSSPKGRKSTTQTEPLLRDAADLGAVGVLRIAAIDVDQAAMSCTTRGRQALRHHVPIAAP